MREGMFARRFRPAILALTVSVCAGSAAFAQTPGSAPARSSDPPPTVAPSEKSLKPHDIERRIDQSLEDADIKPVPEPDYAYGAYQRGYFLTAFAIALEEAHKGDTAAQTLLGELLSKGLGVRQDHAEAAGWYKLAAERGDREALYALGRYFLEGRGVDQDFQKAAGLFEAAGDAGLSIAWRELAYLVLQGKGRDKKPTLGAAYLRKAASRGDMDAQFALGGLYMEGVGVARSETESARWYAEAARNGHVAAQIEYAIALFNGRGVVKDEAVAARWLLQAAQSGNPVAQIRLAKVLAEGRGVEKNERAAAKWYMLARTGGLRDDQMDDWLLTIDADKRKQAEAHALSWPGTGGAIPALQRAPVGSEGAVVRRPDLRG